MTLRILKNRAFARWAKAESVLDADLRRAAQEIESGLIDAKLGGLLLKKRIGRAHGGKRGGFRVVVAYRQGSRLFFIFGFAKNEQANIGRDERRALIKLGDEYMTLSDRKLDELIQSHVMIEVPRDG
jgi:hypothetical protein